MSDHNQFPAPDKPDLSPEASDGFTNQKRIVDWADYPAANLGHCYSSTDGYIEDLEYPKTGKRIENLLEVRTGDIPYTDFRYDETIKTPEDDFDEPHKLHNIEWEQEVKANYKDILRVRLGHERFEYTSESITPKRPESQPESQEALTAMLDKWVSVVHELGFKTPYSRGVPRVVGLLVEDGTNLDLNAPDRTTEHPDAVKRDDLGFTNRITASGTISGVHHILLVSTNHPPTVVAYNVDGELVPPRISPGALLDLCLNGTIVQPIADKQ